jgi:hypothetical protein
MLGVERLLFHPCRDIKSGKAQAANKQVFLTALSLAQKSETRCAHICSFHTMNTQTVSATNQSKRVLSPWNPRLEDIMNHFRKCFDLHHFSGTSEIFHRSTVFK